MWIKRMRAWLVGEGEVYTAISRSTQLLVCGSCGESIPPGDLYRHIRRCVTHQPAIEPLHWPDGKPALFPQDVEPEDFKKEGRR